MAQERSSDTDFSSTPPKLKSLQEVTDIIGVDYNRIIFYIYKLAVKKRYKTFKITKKSGGFREISSPDPRIKYIQQNLNTFLQSIFKPKFSAHGFIKKRSIVTNANPHTHKKHILNVDLNDFFGSINFGRVRGMLIAKPYLLPANIATVIAQICCHDNKLPQGAPTSPTVSNMICARLDSQLLNLARTHRCLYTRYADDITFSTDSSGFPMQLAKEIQAVPKATISLGAELEKIITDNGFKINPSKLRLSPTSLRQEVTGLTTNKFVNVKRNYIKQISAMLNAWKKYGLNNAAKVHFEKYDKKHRHKDIKPSFEKIVRGKIDFLKMVRGENDPLYIKFFNLYISINPTAKGKPILTPKERIEKSLWVLESGLEQGTGFMLKDVGLITCSHVLGMETKAFRCGEPRKKYNITIVENNTNTDIAILKIEGIDLKNEFYLLAESSDEAKTNDDVKILGFPTYRDNDPISSTSAKITSIRNISNVKTIYLDKTIHAGNSGGPVLNYKNEVIGVAIKGDWRNDDQKEKTVQNQAAHISNIKELILNHKTN